MSDDWQPGDLALCVKQPRTAPEIKMGGIYTVSKVWPFRDRLGEIGLEFKGVDGGPDLPGYHSAYAASRFRKIRPHTPDAEDRETIRLLNGVPEPVSS